MIANATPAFRADIQALRGLAILLVLLHHAKLDFVSAGYLGVDIFFVISGYLITGIIRKDIEAGTFQFSRFYFRRAKRLLPAAYVTFFITILLSAAFLIKLEMRDFVRQLIGAVTFSGNIALWLQTGYFEGAANLKPLLHVWSLAIEEQYYMLLPAAMFFLPRRYWLAGAISLVVGSALLCFALAAAKPSATFYLLPTRAWELALGSVGALIYAKPSIRAVVSVAFWPAVLALAIVPVAPTGFLLPWGDAFLVCIATLVVILRAHPLLGHNTILRPLIWLGNISYSLYLVHWPIFAFANNAYVSEVPGAVNASLLAVALLMGYLLYRLVELPVRRTDVKLTVKSSGAILGASCALVLTAVAVSAFFSPTVDYSETRRTNFGFAQACDVDGPVRNLAGCTNAPAPKILVWGDSFAMHLIPGIVATTDLGVAQATRSACAPFIGLTWVSKGQARRRLAEQCIAFNKSVLEYLAKTTSIEYVVLASPFAAYLGGSKVTKEGRVLVADAENFRETDASVPLAVNALRDSVAKIRTLGKRVVVVAPPPSSGFDIGRCLELQASGKLILGADEASCRVSTATYRQHQATVLAFLALLPSQANVNVVSFDEALCSAQRCETEFDGVFLYRDAGHLSVDGSKVLAKRMNLTTRLLSAAK